MTVHHAQSNTSPDQPAQAGFVARRPPRPGLQPSGPSHEASMPCAPHLPVVLAPEKAHPGEEGRKLKRQNEPTFAT
jgi:hypothetical protein